MVVDEKRNLIYEVYSPSCLQHHEAFATAFDYLHYVLNDVANILRPNYFWLTPFYQSGGADGGYDIADLRRIDHRYGTMEDFMAITSDPTLRRNKILLDIVLNHCSTKSQFFQHDLHCASEPANCIWLRKPNNWDSLFGGPAWEYSPERGEYYLHLFTTGQPDLNWRNPAVVDAFREAITFWQQRGVAGFRIDTCNILHKSTLDYDTASPGFTGFGHYHQRGSAAILQQVFGEFPDLFTMGEMIGGNSADLNELCGPLSCCLNAAVNDAADGLFLGRPHELDYKSWFVSLLQWCGVPGFVLQLESHDFPRSPSRFRADPRALALLQFFLPFDRICLYQGQELGLCNPEGQDPTARENARIPAKEIFGAEYDRQIMDSGSILHLYQDLIYRWHTDSVLLYGETHVNCIGTDGSFRFTRRLGQSEWKVNIDLTHPGASFATDGSTTIR